ncbi:16S rRNA (cytosine(967)-C(5))-methyltransferase RsmB [Ferruginivarius sediminum]|uniref:16S rRNA (cytosine(967)-C(5))-methyltransferase n=1 Tax=Ferruginivarius sediminum TaxID=2661937 RepID=A0A369TCX5_9PROT|nr:16S rRNA (cytosine(967)-C(5))-methyltransferase RsmB [Ferruginivarius sediminum]RDD63138.1 16S rRNA (cytosine(967)-C(5))-methyltransferase [Ferruginivarius sediminum]
MTQSPDTPNRSAGRESRRAAFEWIRRILRQGETLEDAGAAIPRLRDLQPRDRAFARLLTTTVLRRVGQLDNAIARCLDRPLKGKLNAVQDLLRLGAAQVLFLDVPAHAAVGETVALATGVRVGPHQGLLNAVLRRLVREREAILADQDAERRNTPRWLWQAWCETYGEETARAIAAQHLQEPPLDISVKADREAWAERLEAEILPTGTLRLPPGSGDVRRLPGYGDGAWWVQDAAAALPARLLGDVSGRHILDLCAAPGGKTAQLAAAGATVLAVDRSKQRLQQLGENLNRLSLAAATVAADLTEWTPPQPAEAILLDAPCTATGTLRRHPDIARLKRPEDVPSMAAVQRDLLAAAAQMLAPGGTLVYAVCSLQPAEGSEQVDVLLQSRNDLERVPVRPEEIGGLSEAITPAGDLRTLPCHLGERGGMDGFYACRLHKRES